MTRGLWLVGGLIALGLGVVGVVLPLIPTVPFLLLAAFCFARSSVRLHGWLLTHPHLGAPTTAWRERGAISAKAKRLASLSITATLGLTLAMGVPGVVLVGQAVVLTAVLLFIWSRPAE